MIVFGHNSFLLNKCKPSQLGMSPDLDALYTIERRQRYFHLFWIPVFGIGKIWALRKSTDNQLYNPNDQLEEALNALSLKEKTPWYTYSFLLLVVTGFALFFISQSVSDYQSNRRYEAYRLEKNKTLKEAIAKPQPFHYYSFNSGATQVYLKVLSGDAQTLTCLVSKKQDNNYSEERLLEAFVTDSDNRSFDTVRIKKSDFAKTIDEKVTYGFKGYEIIAGEGQFVLNEFKVFDFPVFRNLQSAYEEGKFRALIQNIGADATFQDIRTETSNMAFDGELIPAHVTAGDIFEIQGTYTDAEPKLQSKVRVINSLNDSSQYDFSIRSFYVTLKKSNR